MVSTPVILLFCLTNNVYHAIIPLLKSEVKAMCLKKDYFPDNGLLKWSIISSEILPSTYKCRSCSGRRYLY